MSAVKGASSLRFCSTAAHADTVRTLPPFPSMAACDRSADEAELVLTWPAH